MRTPCERADQAKPPQRKLDVLHQTPLRLQRIGPMKKAFMLSEHNEAPMRDCRSCYSRRRLASGAACGPLRYSGQLAPTPPATCSIAS